MLIRSVRLASGSSKVITSAHRCLSTSVANMSASTSTKHAYLAMLPDFTEGSKRMSVREQHLVNAAKLHENGTLIQGGATLSADPATSEQQQMTGSFMLFYAENIDKARELLESDIYTKGGAWDMSKATITPVRVAKH